MQLIYKPVPSLVPFLTSDEFISFVTGPVGSTKTTASIIKIAYEASRIAKSQNGLRKSRCAVVRSTRQQLLDTTVPDFMKWFPDGQAGTWNKTDMKYTLKFNDVECEILFRGLDDTSDVRRLLSLQLSFAMIDEAKEIHQEVFNALTGRVGRYPDGILVPHRKEWGEDEKGNPIAGCVDDNGKPLKKIWGATNPPSMDTFWYEMLSDPPKGWHVDIQPSGLSPEADWIHLLPSNYYEDLMPGKSQEWIDVFIHSKWGVSLSGRPVVTCFAQDHVSKFPLQPIKLSSNPIIIGMDFGLNPSALLGQIDPRGRVLVLDEITGVDMGLVRFIDTRLKPLLSTKYAGYPVIIVGDPAGVQRQQGDEKSCYDILKTAGFKAIPARTNSIVERIGATERVLTKYIDGAPGALVDPGCRKFIAAMRGEYRYKLKKNGEYEDTPEKNMASHIADASQYLFLHISQPMGGAHWQTQRREIKPVSYRGWA